MNPMKLESVYVPTIWQGDKLEAIRKNGKSGGTSWDVSAHPHADNTILSGEFKGKKLSWLLDTYPEEMLGNKKRSQMLRLSILDAKESLSIQVHPTDEYAHQYENDEGKTEAWYIIKADEGAKLIAGTTAKNVDEIKQAVEAGTIEELVRTHEMEAGDMICIDAGQLHALGGGIMALEVSQNSDVTYRFYDFNRVDAQGNKRELHLKKSYDVVDCSKQCEKEAFPLSEPFRNERKTILDIEEFTVDVIDLDGEYTLETDGETFYCLTNVEAAMEISFAEETMPFAFTESIFVPAQSPDVTLRGKGRVVISYVK